MDSIKDFLEKLNEKDISFHMTFSEPIAKDSGTQFVALEFALASSETQEDFDTPMFVLNIAFNDDEGFNKNYTICKTSSEVETTGVGTDTTCFWVDGLFERFEKLIEPDHHEINLTQALFMFHVESLEDLYDQYNKIKSTLIDFIKKESQFADFKLV